VPEQDLADDAQGDTGSPGKLVGALTSGLSILRYLSRVDAPVGVTQVARDLELNTSTCFNLLKTLVHERLVTFQPATKTYVLGLGFVELAKQTLEKASFARMIRPHLEALVSEYSITTTLWQRSGDDRVVLIDRADCDSAIRVHMTIGQRLPTYIAALGRAMAASSGLSRGELRQRFTRLRWQNAPSFDEYYAEVEDAADKGYAVDVDRYVRGVTTISAPIYTGESRATMAISAIGFTGQFSGSMIEDIGNDLRHRAESISVSLTGDTVPQPRRRERAAD
jgi:DNA-binding IclR family transcriptional regulator